MSGLKPCPFCGARAKVEDHGSFKIVGCSKLSMLCPNPRMTVYNDNFHHWNQRAETETEKSLTAIATKHATRADELYDALDNLLELIDSCEGLAGINRSQYIIEPSELSAVVEARETLDKSRIEAEQDDA